MSETVPLKPSHRQLLAGWEGELREVQQKIGSIFNELALFRLEKIALELGIDTAKGDWTFDFQKKEFVKIEKPQEVKATIPGRKRGRPKKEDVAEEPVDAEVVDEEPIPPEVE